MQLAPSMTSEMAGEELARPDKSNMKDKGIWLESFAKRLKTLVLLKELNLDEIFTVTKPLEAISSSNDEGSIDAPKRVA